MTWRDTTRSGLIPNSKRYPPPTDLADLAGRFDSLYKRATRFNASLSASLCAICAGSCCRGRHTALGVSFCCGGEDEVDFPGNTRCRHLGSDGCTVQSLRCKLWFCGDIASSTVRVILHDGSRLGLQTANRFEFRGMVAEADYYGFLVRRGTRNESIRQAATKWGIHVGAGEIG